MSQEPTQELNRPEAKRGFLRFCGSVLGRCLPRGLPLPILRGPLRWSWWAVGAAAGPGAGLSVIFNQSEPERMMAVYRVLQGSGVRDGVCFDVGANCGLYTLLFARHSRSVVAFEPDPLNIRQLMTTIANNRLNNVTVVPGAVSDSSTLSSFSRGSTSETGHLDGEGSQPVFTVSCDAYAERFKVVPALLKIDVEGAEVDVLRGATRLLGEYHPPIVLEIHSARLRDDCFAILRGHGYASFVPIDNPDPNRALDFIITADVNADRSSV